MAVVLGDAVVSGSKVVIRPPEGGFGGIEAVRLSNYTGDALILSNIYSDRPGQEYLLPFQQMVYAQINVRQPPSASGIVLGSGFATADLLVEWSTEPQVDFPGTYPQTLVQASLIGGGSAPVFRVQELLVPNDAATHSIPAQLSRASLTFFVDGLHPVAWRDTDAGWGVNDPLIQPASGRTVNTTATIFFRATGAGDTSVQWFVTGFGI